MARRILVAVDLSEHSALALREAFARASSTGATLAVCHVIPAFQDVSVLFPQDHQDAMLRFMALEEQAMAAVTEHVAAVLGANQIEILLSTGADYAGIVRAAASWRADLIVVGGQGRGGLAKTLLGSVAERVVRYATCPVLVARAAVGTGGVLVATDLSDASLPAIAAGAAEARWRRVRLIVVHALDVTTPALGIALGSPFGATPTLPQPELQQELRSLLLASLTRAVQSSGAEGEARIIEGSPAAAIVAFAEEIAPELLVVGTHGRTGLARVALGSVAEYVIRHTQVPVLAVRVARA